MVSSAAAWKVKPRDVWIDWSRLERKKNLQLIVNIFLILPWVQVKNLASKILSQAVQKLPENWKKTYSYRPVLLETFVEKERLAGTCYKAANWIFVGRRRAAENWTGLCSLNIYVQPNFGPKKTGIWFF